MKYTHGKRIWSMILVICLMLSLMPAFVSHVEVEAEAVSGVDSLTCAGFISNSTRRNYIDTMMKYYINNYSSLQTTLNNGLSVVFMFEGGSDYYDTYEYIDANGTTRLQAVCIVVQLNSSGNAEIVFYSENCSSIPDDANYVTAGNETNGSTTILDGIYGFQTVNHLGNYAGFNTYCSTGWYNPYEGSTGYSGYCDGINLHTRSVSYCAGKSYGWCNSAGCQVIGYGANSSNEYNDFVKTVAGINYNAYDGTQRTYSYNSSSPGTYVEMGYYVVDRQLGLLSPDGTLYGSGSLAELYTTADLDGITAFSTAARANADFGYTSKCTFYPSHCQFTTTKSTPINTEPCSAGNNGSETLETVASGTTCTAIGMYQNTGSNFWYQVKTSSGEIGYIYSGHTKYVDQLTSDITISDYDAPNGHVSGDVFYVTGDISSKYNLLNTAAVWIHSGFGTSGSKITGYSDDVGGYSYSLLNSDIDYNTAFNTVGTGEYTYAISVTYTNYYAKAAQTLGTNTGTKYLVEEYFVVVSSSVDQSTCSHSNTTTTIKAATCTASGTSAVSCSKCGLVTETTVAALGHSYGGWTTVNATCTADGSKARTCSACGNVETQTIAATGHDYDLVTHAATCKEYEIYEYTCGSCGDTYTLNAGELASGWIDYLPEGLDASLFTSKTQYRYSDYETTTSYATSLDGYTQKSSTWEESGSGTVTYVPSWPSGFSTSSSLYTTYNKASSKVSESQTTTEKTVIDSDDQVGYLYYHWCYSGSTYSTESSSGSYTTFHAFYSTTTPPTTSGYYDSSDCSHKMTENTVCSNSDWFFHTDVYTQSYTNYKKLFTYERWTDYTDWSDTAVTASSTRKVETRTVYQLKSASLGDHAWDSGVVTTAATCTADGVRTYTCSVCSTTKTEPIAATGHSYSGGTCSVCGAADPNAAPFTLAGANMVLGGILEMNFFINQTDISGTGYYAVITHYAANGTRTVTVPYSEWGTYGTYYMVTLEDLEARQMADKIEVVIYKTDGTKASETWTDSVRDYTMRTYAARNEEGKTLLVDMLNYGAAAQTFFGYNATDLANNQLTATQQAKATASVSCTDQRTYGSNYVGSALVLESRIILTVLFQDLTTDMYAVVSYTDHYGESKTVRVEGSDFVSYYSYYGIQVDDLVVADGDVLVTVMVYNANGSLVGWASDSMNSYAARNLSKDSIYEMVAKFTASAYAYFH